MSNFDQNANHTNYNQTSAYICNSGQHAADQENNVLFDSVWIAEVDYD